MAKKKQDAPDTVSESALDDNRRSSRILREARANLDVDALLGETQRLKARVRQLEAKLKEQGK